LPQNGAGGDDDRQLRGGDIEVRQQGFHLGVTVGIEPFVGHAGSDQELPDAHGFGREP
jgi:hypothetical protein